jgi:hypothetical protein
MAARACGFLFLLLMVIGNPSFVVAQTDPKLDAVIERLTVDVDIQSTGDASLKQSVEYRFLRDSTYIDYSFDTSGTIGLDLVSVEIADLPESGLQEVMKPHLLRAGEEPTAMSYEIQQSEDVLDMRIHMPVKAGTNRVVRFQFTMYNAIRLYEDVADFKLVLLSPDITVNRFTATVRAARPLIDGRVFATGSDGLLATVNPVNGEIVIQDNVLSAGENVRIRCLLPSLVFSASKNRFAGNAMESMVIAENKLSDADTHMRELRKSMPVIRLVLLAIALPLLLMQYLLYDRERPTTRRTRSIPDMGGLPPPVFGLLLHRRVSGRELTASLYDLAARGCLRIEGHTFIRVWDDKRVDELLDYDRFLMQWMIKRIGEDNRVTAPMVTQAARGAGPAGFHHAYGVFKQLLRAHSRRIGLVDRVVVLRGRIQAAVLGGIYTMLAVAIALLEHSAASLALLVPAAIFSLYFFRVRRLTPFGNEQMVIARTFCKNLQRSADAVMSEPISPETWSRYLPYAIALGVADAYLDHTARIFSYEDMCSHQMFTEYGMSYPTGVDKDEILRGFHTQLKGNTAAFLTATLYTSERMV